jgi:hypothetical protein
MSGSRRFALIAAALLVMVASADGHPGHAGPAGAEVPYMLLDTRPVPPGGRVLALAAGGDLQAVLDGARAGDTIVLPAGATFRGPLRLPRVSGDRWIEIRSSAADDLTPGRRVSPADAPKMARILGGEGSAAAVLTAPGAHHFRFVGIEFTVTPGAYSNGLVRFGTGEETHPADLPHHLVIDRCWVHGDPARGGKRGLAMNAAGAAVVDSYFSDWKGEGQETQAIAAWNGPGPFKIANNYLAAAGINVLFGGADPSIPNLVPSDIEVRGNTFTKPLAWRQEPWTVKNLLELKNARRVLVVGNLFEHTWGQAQAGTAILLSPRNQDGHAPWSGVEDVTFADNVVRGAASGIKIGGRDDSGPTRITRRVVIRNNLFDDIDGSRWGGDGRLFTILLGTESVSIEHNTGFATGTLITAEGPPHLGFVFADNIVSHGQYGIKGSGLGVGEPTLRALFPGARVEGNVFIGRDVPAYPKGNLVAASVNDVGFVDAQHGDWRLTPGSRFKAAGHGRDPGADVEVLRGLIRRDGGDAR